MSMLWIMQHLPAAVFAFCFGACVGSFLNVVIYRLPERMSVIEPPSRCPTCGVRLSFFTENLPILGWFLVRGRCRACGERVSPQYMVVEVVMALAFLGFYLLLFARDPSWPWWLEIGGDWWRVNGIGRAWPAFLTVVFLVSGLFAMTVIDARTFTIPIQVPLFVTIAAFIAWPLQAMLPLKNTPGQPWPIPLVGWTGVLCSLGGLLGIAVGLWALSARKIRYSFHDYEDYLEEGETLADYPHARREMGVELLFLAPCLLGMVVGGMIGARIETEPPLVVAAFGATAAGYLWGCGLIWGIRILGTLAFGKEAMGLGDVHLLGAVGAVLGWVDPILVFFIAPFSGLLWTVVSIGIASVSKGPGRELPYGPHLAVGTLIMILLRPEIRLGLQTWLPGVPWP